MSGQIEPITITEIAKILEDGKNESPKIALLLGSRAGALFRSERLYEDLAYYSTRVFADMTPWERFRECYNVLQQTDEEISKSDLIVSLNDALSGIKFSKADIALADLIRQGVFKLIISANVDELLYDAMIRLEMKEESDFVDFRLASSFIQDKIINDIVFHDKKNACKIIHISDEITKLVYELNQPDAQQANSRFIKRLLARLGVKEVLVIGVDAAWDSALMVALPERIQTIWFVNEDREVMDQFFAGNRAQQCRCIIGKNGSYENFLKVLHWDINKDIPEYYNLHFEVLTQLHSMQSQLRSTQNQLKVLMSEMEQTKNMVKAFVSEMEQTKNMVKNIARSIEELEKEKRQGRGE